MATGYHEAFEQLSPTTKDLHRALNSLQEEIEAIDWYTQRIDQATDQELKEILDHNRLEEVEHAAMLLEWIRRSTPQFDEPLRTYLFTQAPLLQIEEAQTAAPDEGQEATVLAPPEPGDLRIRKP